MLYNIEKMNLSKDLEAFFYKSSTQDFLKFAQDFVELLENINTNKVKFYRDVQQCLANLYSSGIKLESVELKYFNKKIDPRSSEIELFKSITKNLMSVLGEECYYSKVFDPMNKNESKPIQGWLVDDFSDIYLDLKTELLKIETMPTDASIEDALWNLKFGFYTHWGNHCISAMQALHYLLNDDQFLENS